MEEYKSAAIRHYVNAKLLKDAGQLDNSGHLIGFAAECAIKYRLTTLSNAEGPHGHFPEFQKIAIKHLRQRSGNTTSMLDLLKNEVLRGWTVVRRYYATGNTTIEELEMWFKDTQRIFACANIKAHV